MQRGHLLAVALVGVVGAATGCYRGPDGHRPSPADVALGAADDCAAYRRADVQAALDRRTGSQVRTGNQVELLVNGRAAFARRFANGKDADVLLVKTFIFSDDEVGRRTANLLIGRARAGAVVVLQYDVKGSIGSKRDVAEMLANATPFNPAGEKHIIKRMRDAGIVIVPTNSPLRALEAEEWATNIDRLLRDPAAAIERSAETLRIIDRADHEKYWITGKRTPAGGVELRAIIGGMNLASEYAYGGTRKVDAGSKRGGWRDTDLELRGPVVNDIVERFYQVMEHHLGGPLAPATRAEWNPPQPAVGQARVRFVWNHPAAGNQRRIERLYATLMDATPRGGVVRLESAYFAPGKILRLALRRALERGVRIGVLSNSDDTNDIKIVAHAGRFAYWALLKLAGKRGVVALYERLPRPDVGELTLHSKVASFGRCGPAIVGSANLDAQSSEHNSESVVLVDDGAFRAAFDVMYDRDVSPTFARRIGMDDFRNTSTWDWLKQAGIYHLAWYWM